MHWVVGVVDGRGGTISVGIRDVVCVGLERDTTWMLGCCAGGGGRAWYSGRRIRGHWDQRGVRWVLWPWDGRQLSNEEGCMVSWWVSHSLGLDASTGSEGLRWRGIRGGTGTCASLRAGISGDRVDKTDEGGRAGVCEAKVGGTA